MDGPILITGATDPLEKNLTALRRFQPTIAELLEHTAVPLTVTPVSGRDGSPTFTLPGDRGERMWFGRSSMPTVSAEALYGETKYEGTNVSLPSIFTGVELRVLAHRLPPQCAIFVVEDDPLSLRLAMQLHDYSQLIAAGRAVFLDARNLRESLRDFFSEHPGYELPRTLFTGAVRVPAQIAELQRRFELAGEAAFEVQTTAVVASVERLRERPVGKSDGAPRVALLSVDQRLETLDQGHRFARSLPDLELAYSVCLPDAPNRCHVLAGLHAVESIDADLVLVLNVGVERWRALLPENVPIGAVVLTEEAVPRSVLEALAPRDLVFAASHEIEEAVLANGLPSDQCRRLDPSAEDGPFRQTSARPGRRPPPRFDVALIADIPDDRPEVNGVALTSHVSLWKSLCTAAEGCAETPRLWDAKWLLEQARRESLVELEDSGVHAHFLELTRRRITPAASARHACDALAREGFRIGLWGTNWNPKASGTEWLGAVPPWDELRSLAESAAILVFPIPDRRSVQLSLDAIASGAEVLLRVGERPFSDEYPQLAALTPSLRFYRQDADLRAEVRARFGPRTGAPAILRDAVRAGHTTGQRIQWMLNELRTHRETVLCGLS